MSKMIDVGLQGSVNTKGQIGGTGSLVLKFTDATKSLLTIDYSESDKVTLRAESSVGIHFSADRTLTFGGSLNYNVLNKQFDGSITAEFSISKNIAAQIEQSFAASGNATTLTVKISL